MVLINTLSKKSSNVFNAIVKLEEVHHVFQMTGRYDLVAIFHVKNTDHANQILRRIKEVNGVKNAEMMIVTGLLKIETSLKI